MVKKKFIFSVLCAIFAVLLPLSHGLAATSRNLHVDSLSNTSYPEYDKSRVYVNAGEKLKVDVDSYGNDDVILKITSGGKTIVSRFVGPSGYHQTIYVPVGYAYISLDCRFTDFCDGRGIIANVK